MAGPWEAFGPAAENKPPWEQYGGSTTEPARPKTGIIRRIADMTAVPLAQGVVGVPEAAVGIADILTGGVAGNVAERAGFRPAEAKQIIGDAFYSDAQVEADRKVADAEGFVDTALTALQNPSTIARTTAESVPTMAAGGAISRIARAVAPTLTPVAAGAAGEGAVMAGQAAENIRRESADGLLTPQQAALAATTGVAGGVISRLAGSAAARAGIGDVENILAGGAAAASSKGPVRRVAEGALREGVFEELPQSAQEQVLQNLALGRPWDEGVGAAAAQGMLAGGLVGGAAGAVGGRAPAPSDAPAAEPAAKPLLVGNTPDPLVSFADGTVGRRSEIEAYINALPEERRAAARARLLGLQPQPADETSPGAAPAARAEPATTIEAPDWSTGQGAPQPAANGIEFRQDIDTGDLQLLPPQPTTSGSLTGTNPADLLVDPMESPSRLMGIDPSAGPISRAAALAVDSGATQAVAAAAAQGKETDGTKKTPAPGPEAQPAQAPAAVGGGAAQAAAQLPGAGPAGVEAAGVAPATFTPQPGDIVVDEHFEGAHRAATSPLNDRKEPSQAQKDAEVYAVGRTRVGGMAVSIENPQGTERRGKDEDGKEWATLMTAHYGRLPGTKAADSTRKKPAGLDVFIKPGTPKAHAGPVFVVDQVNPTTGKFDEHKVIFGATSEADAEAIYRSNYTADWKGLGSITGMPKAAFKAWAYDGKRKSSALGDLSRWSAAPDARAAALPAAPANPQPRADGAPVAPAGGRGEPPASVAKPSAIDALSERLKRDNAQVNAELEAQRNKDVGYKAPEDMAAVLRKAGAKPDSTTKETEWTAYTNENQSGEVLVSFDPATNKATVKANYMGRDYDTRTVEGAAALAEAIERARDGIEAGRMEMARRVASKRLDEGKKSVTGATDGPQAVGVAKLGVATAPPAKPKKPAGGRIARSKAWDANPLRAFLGAHGITLDLAKDFAPGLRERRAAMVPGHGPIFRKTGKQIDELAQLAVEEGFLPPGEADAGAMYELIAQVFRGERVAPLYAEGAIEQEVERRLQDEIDAHPELDDLIPDDLEAEGYDRASPEVQAEVRALIAQAEAGGLDVESVLEEVAKRNENASQDEYLADARQVLEAALAGPAAAGAQDRGGPAGAQTAEPQGAAAAEGLNGEAAAVQASAETAPSEAGPAGAQDDPEGLTSPTPEEVVAQQRRREEGERAESQRKKEEEARARADAERDEFTLTGSDRPADANPDQGGLFAQEPQSDYTGGYETDLFGDPLPEPTGRARRAAAARQGVRGDAQRSAVPGDAAQDAPGEFYVETLVSTPVQRQLGAKRITSPADLAQATQYLYKSAVERFDAIVTDKGGKPLAVVGNFKGAVTQTSVYPSTVVGEAIRVPGAANIWFSHNHPSGTSTLSRADENLSATLREAFRGTGIQARGVIAVAKGRYAFDGDIGAETGSIKPAEGPVDVPVYERELRDDRQATLPISSPQSAKEVARQFHGKAKEPGLLLLDAQNQVAAWVPLSGALRGQLRGTGGLAALYKALSRSNASSAIMVHAGELDAPVRAGGHSIAENIGGALRGIDVRPLDAINVSTGESRAEKGLEVGARAFFSRAQMRRGDAAVGRELRVTQMQRAVSQLTRDWLRKPDIFILDSMADAPEPVRREWQRQDSQGAAGTIEGFHYRGGVYLMADSLASLNDVRRVLFHESLGHFGLRGHFGGKAGLDPILRQLAAMRPQLIATKAEQYGLDITNEKDRLIAAEEVLAEMAQDRPEIGWVRRAVAVIRKWLRQHGVRMGLSDNDIIANYILPARGWVERGKSQMPSFTEEARASRAGPPVELDPAALQGNIGEQVAQARLVAMQQFAGKTVRNGSDGSDIIIPGSGIKHALSGKVSPLAALAATRLDQIVGRAKFVSSAPDREGRNTIKEVRFYEVDVKAGEQSAVMRVVVRVASDGSRYYDHFELKEKAPAGMSGEQGDPGSLRPTAGAVPPEGDGPILPPDDDAVFSRAAAAPSPAGAAAPPARKAAPSLITGQPLPNTWRAPDASRLDDVIYTMQDKHVDTKRVLQEVRAAVGRIADEQDPYLQEELYHGRAAKQTKDFLDQEIRPLLMQARGLGVDLSDFEEYLHNRHAEARNVQVAKVNPDMPDGGSGIKTADARAYLKALPADKRKAFEAMAKRVEDITRATRQLLVDSGLEKQETIDAWQAAYGDEYVPLMREEMDEGRTGIGQGYSVRGGSSKRAMGSGKPVADILANIAMQREKAITRAQKRRIGEALYGLVLKAPNPDFWMAIDPALEQDPGQLLQTATQLVSMGLDPADAQSIAAEPRQRYIGPDGKVAWRINPAMRGADNVMAVRIDGEDKYVIFNARDPRAMRMVTAMKNLDADQLGTVMGTVAKMTRYFAAINTQYNPIFGVTNITRDVQTALLNLQSTALKGRQGEVMKHVLPALKGIYLDLRAHRAGKMPTSQYAQLFEEFQREGGATGYRDMFANARERAEAIADELAAIKDGSLKRAGRGIMGWLSDYNEAMENAVRVAAYKVGKEQGLTNQQAASIAKNLTVNFNRKGQAALQAGALYAFFNASVQGTARIGQTLFADGKLTTTGRKIIVGGVTLGVLQAVLLAAAGYDDEEPPDFVRERSLVLPVGDGKYVSIPMPLGFHVLPNLGRIPAEWVMGGFRDTPMRIAQMVALFADAFNPIGSAGLSLQTITPTIIDPLAALSENRDWTGKPIAKQDFDSMRPTAGHTRAKDTATPWARLLSYGVNVATGGTDFTPGQVSPTPDQIDYIIGQVTGGVGREAGKLAQVASSATSGEELPLYKVPLVGRFVGSTEGQAAEASRFYDNLRQIGAHKVEVDGLRKAGRGEEVQGYLQENPTAKLVIMANYTQREIAKARALKRELVDKDAPRDQVQAVDARITTLMRALNERVRALEPA